MGYNWVLLLSARRLKESSGRVKGCDSMHTSRMCCLIAIEQITGLVPNVVIYKS